MHDLEQVADRHHASTLEWFRTAKNYVKYANQGGMLDDVERYIKQYSRYF
jgi:hypothetical protein